MTLKVAVQRKQLHCQIVAYQPLLDEIGRRDDVQLVKWNESDIGLVQGDTLETLYGAMDFLMAGIPIAHLYGGDISGGTFPDNKIRPAVSMLSDYHFPSTIKSAQNLAKMGIDKSRIFTAGDPIFDIINQPRGSREELLKKYAAGNQPIAIATLHREIGDTQAQFYEKQTMIQTIVHDLGMRLLPPETELRVEPETWFEYMTIASVFVTNSSSGIAEAPSFSLPCVQVGDRQKGRETAGNVLWASYDPADIEEKVKIALEWKQEGLTWKNPYDRFGPEYNNCKAIIDKLVEVMK